MQNQLFKRPAFIYLSIVPFLTAAVGFGIGGFSNTINIPIWIIHTILMFFLFRKTGARLLTAKNNDSRQWISASLLLFVPWILFTLFAGFGPPPSTPEAWANNALQQQIRYTILAIGGIVSAFGFASLSQRLKHYPGNSIAKAGMVLIYIATPLFVLNMLYWGFFLTYSFRLFTNNGITDRPDWYLLAKEIFYWISTLSLALLYLSITLFATALKKSSIFKAGACNVYIAISLFGFICSFIPPGLPAPFDVIGYLVAVPAISFIMPYLISLNLAAKSSY